MMPWGDVYVQLIDTAPITNDVFDANTQALIRGAELVILMLDLGSDDGGEQLMDCIRKINETKSRLGNETKIDENDIGVTYTKTIMLNNKIDLNEAADRLEFFEEYIDVDFERHSVSALTGEGLQKITDLIYEAMGVIRVYTKLPTKKEPDMENPFTLTKGQTLVELAELVHRDIANNLKGARVWGEHVHDGTQVRPDYELRDRDVVELHA